MSSGKTSKAIRVPGGRLVRLESDLSIDVVAKIADAANLNLLFMLSTPELGSGVHFAPLYSACCKVANVEPPSVVTSKVYFDAIEEVPDDLPEEYVDDLPKEGGSSTT